MRFKAHRLLYNSTLGLRVIKKKKIEGCAVQTRRNRGTSVGEGTLTAICGANSTHLRLTPRVGGKDLGSEQLGGERDRLEHPPDVEGRVRVQRQVPSIYIYIYIYI